MQKTNLSSITSTCDIVTKRNPRYFDMTLQLLQISPNIIYTYYCDDFTVTFRHIIRFYYYRICITISQICIILITFSIYLLYCPCTFFYASRTCFRESIYRLYQFTKEVHGTRKVKNPWSKYKIRQFILPQLTIY